MGKRFLFLAVVANVVLIAISAVQGQAEIPAELAKSSWCCDGGQCIQAPVYICMWRPSCDGDSDCTVF